MTSNPRQPPLLPSHLSSSSSKSSGPAIRVSNPYIGTRPPNFKAQFLEMLNNRVYKKHHDNSACLPHIGKEEVKKTSRRKEEMKIRNWIELPSEVWVIILSKVKTMDIIENVQKVCMLFRNICKQPSLYAAIDMSTPVAYGFTKIPIDIHVLTCYAINRSLDRLSGVSDIYIEYFCEPKTFKYIGGRCNTLKKLRLGHFHNSPSELYEALIEAIKRLPLLEEVQFRNCDVTRDDVIEGVGHACSSLKSFALTEYLDQHLDQYFYSRDALAISRSMPNLRRLTITGNGMANRDLEVILDGCPFLEYLDLRGCRRIDLSGNLGKRCVGIKHL